MTTKVNCDRTRKSRPRPDFAFQPREISCQTWDLMIDIRLILKAVSTQLYNINDDDDK